MTAISSPLPDRLTIPPGCAENRNATGPTLDASTIVSGQTWRTDLAIVALLVMVQLVFFTGFGASDDLGYMNCARHATAANSTHPNYVLRFMHWGMLAAAIRLLPDQPWTPGVPPMILMATMLLIIGKLARRAGLRRPWIPMVLFGIMPLNLLLASMAMPDLTAATLAWLGIAICGPTLLEHNAPRAGVRCLIGGLLMVSAYNAKETTAILIPSLCLFVLLFRTREAWAWKRAGLLLISAAAWVGTETALLYYWTGDPLYHSHTLARIERMFRPVEPQAGFSWVIAYASEYLRWLANPRSAYGPVGLLLLIGSLVAIVRVRHPVSRLLACLILPCFVYLSAGSSSLSAYDPVGHHPRYLLPILPAMALATGIVIDRLWSTRPTWRIPLGLAMAGVVAACLVVVNRTTSDWYYVELFRTGRSLIAEHAKQNGDAPLYAARYSFNCFQVPAEWLGGPPPVRIDRPPLSREEWIARYGGCYVLTTRLDRNRPRKPSQADRTLRGPSVDALRTFPCVARREPPRDRFSVLAARILGRECPTNPRDAVEIYHVPTASSAISEPPAPEAQTS
jgi:hypothetical protein